MLALVIGLALVVPALLNQCRGPEVVLREYLDALVAGDTATLREHTSTDRVTGTAAMTDPIYSAATDRVQDYEILDLRTEGTAATATVQLDNGTEKHESTLSLTGRSENFYSPLQWRMDPVAYGEVTLAKPPDAEEISVNGTMLGAANLHRTAADGHSEPVLQLLPVTYEVILPANGELVTPVPTEIAVAPSLGVDAPSVAGRPLRYDITEAGRQEVERQVVGRLEECAATAQALQPDHCPFAVPVGEREVGRPPREGPGRSSSSCSWRSRPWTMGGWTWSEPVAARASHPTRGVTASPRSRSPWTSTCSGWLSRTRTLGCTQSSWA